MTSGAMKLTKARFELNAIGREQLSSRFGRKGRSNSGSIIGESGKCWRVKFDNRKTPYTIFKGYIDVLPAGRSALGKDGG